MFYADEKVIGQQGLFPTNRLVKELRIKPLLLNFKDHRIKYPDICQESVSIALSFQSDQPEYGASVLITVPLLSLVIRLKINTQL